MTITEKKRELAYLARKFLAVGGLVRAVTNMATVANPFLTVRKIAYTEKYNELEALCVLPTNDGHDLIWVRPLELLLGPEDKCDIYKVPGEAL